MSREMIFSENEYDRMNYLMTAIMDAGELLAMHGAEVSRVEDTITRLCKAYGFVRADVFTITSSIIVTAMLSDGRTMTQTRRIRTRTTDLEKVAKVNELSRRICADPAGLNELKAGLDAIKNGKRISVSLELAMHMMIASSPVCLFRRDSDGRHSGSSFRRHFVCYPSRKCSFKAEYHYSEYVLQCSNSNIGTSFGKGGNRCAAG